MSAFKRYIKSLEKLAAPLSLVPPAKKPAPPAAPQAAPAAHPATDKAKFQQYKEDHPGTKKTPNDPMFLSTQTRSGKGIPAPAHPIYQKELKGEQLAHDLPHYTAKDHREVASIYKGDPETRHMGYAHHRAADWLDFQDRMNQQPARRVANDIQKAIDALQQHEKNKKKPTPEQTAEVLERHKKWKAEDAARAPKAPAKNKFQEYKSEHPLTKKTPNDPMFLSEKTQSGKDIPSPKHPAYNRESEFHGAHDAARDFKGWTPQDHLDAAAAHKKHEGPSNGRDAQTSMIHQDAAHLVKNNKPHYSTTPEWTGKPAQPQAA